MKYETVTKSPNDKDIKMYDDTDEYNIDIPINTTNQITKYEFPVI